MKMRVFVMATLLSLAATGVMAESTTLQISRITPSGSSVEALSQIVIQFNKPMVPLGRMERESSEVPVEIAPALACKWRWVDRSALACQLDDADKMKFATSYKVTVKPGIKAEDGSTLAEQVEHSFTTSLPSVRYTHIRKWIAPGTPAIRVVFSQPVSRQSVQDAMFFQANGRDYPLIVEQDMYDRRLPRFIRVPGEPYFVDFGDQAQDQSGGEEAADEGCAEDEEPPCGQAPKEATVPRPRTEGEEAREAWMVKPAEELPLDTAILLNVKPGLESALGPQRGEEKRTAGQYHTFPEFEFLGVDCRDIEGEDIHLPPGQSQAAGDLCNPMESIFLVFSAPTSKDEVKEKLIFSPKLAVSADSDPWGMVYSYSSLEINHDKDNRYRLSLPYPLKARKTYKVKGELEDLFGRRLKTAVDMTFTLDARPPDYTLTHHYSVLESGVESETPIYVTNLNSVDIQYHTLTAKGRQKDLSAQLKPDKVDDLSFAIPLHVRKMLGGGSGAIQGWVSSDPAPYKEYEEDSFFFSQVTPYQVLVKKGHFNTMVWVTDMATGKPVDGANVSLYLDTYLELAGGAKILTEGATGADGVAALKGYSEYDPKVIYGNDWFRYSAPRHFVKVTKGSQMALLPLDHDFAIDSYRISGSVYPDEKEKHGHMRAWGATAQGIYKAGDNIEYKIYVREQNVNRFIPAPKGKYTLQVYDPMGKVVHERKDIVLSQFGAFDGAFVTAKSAAVGWYRFSLTASFTKRTWTPLEVLVTDFTPSPFKVAMELNGGLFRAGDEVETTTRATMHSGGPYTGGTARVTAMFRGTPFQTKSSVASGFYFHTGYGEDQKQFYSETAPMDANGELAKKIKLDGIGIIYGKISVEGAVADDRGKNIASLATADYRGVDRMVGLKHTQWIYKTGEKAEIQALVADELGEPAAGTDVTVNILRKEMKSSRVKGAGNTYQTQYTEDWISAGSCQMTSQAAAVACSVTPKEPGLYKFIASIKDTQGRDHSTQIMGYVVGKGYVVWESGENYALSIVPEKNEYTVGQTARYLVQNPYPGATALVTVERFGVLDRWVLPMPDSTAVVEFPVKPDYLPGYYLSVAVVSPRVEKPNGLGELDLGKPAIRMGYISAPVRDEYKMVDTTVTSDKTEYRPRQTVTLSLKSAPRRPTGADKPPVELAVAVLDEAVLDLIRGGTGKYDPYGGFYSLDSLDVLNYTTLTRLIGRQKFEKKGANAGGDGGAELAMRSFFKFVAYWNPSIQVDKDGAATVSFQLPDNLTGWRVLAMAVTPEDRMGLGQGSFKVNRPTEVRPVMPNQVTEGDRFKAGFSVMNRTDKERAIKVDITAEGDIKTGPGNPASASATLKLAPYQRQVVWLDVATKAVEQTFERPRGEVRFKAIAGDAMDKDGLEHQLPVNKRRTLFTAANYGTAVDEPVEEAVELPAMIYPDFGSVGVTLSPTVIGNAEGAFKYMRDYPYICWEQKLSKGVMASHYVMLKKYLPDSLEWSGAQTLADNTLELAVNFQAPNGGMVFYIPEDRYVSPYLSAYTALAFNWLRRDGHQIPPVVEDKLTGYLQNLLRKNDYPSWYSDGMASSVRAVALLALVERGKAGPAEVRRYAPHLKQMDIFGKAHFMKAALAFAETAPLARGAAQEILGFANQTGGKFILSEEYTDGYYRILTTPLRSNCAALSAFAAYAATADGKAMLGDVPFKMVRSITQTRGKRDHWENTQENMFCMNALVE
ncbi:MAG: MG2 domain-containing protein, partial [Nitrospinota bacterium]|nr:MG2 domain-containing protein [Nitrospinota bacterium]